MIGGCQVELVVVQHRLPTAYVWFLRNSNKQVKIVKFASLRRTKRYSIVLLVSKAPHVLFEVVHCIAMKSNLIAGRLNAIINQKCVKVFRVFKTLSNFNLFNHCVVRDFSRNYLCSIQVASFVLQILQM